MITRDDIRYQIKASKKLNTDFFKEFVLSVVEKFNGYKKAINGFIGRLAKNYSTNTKLYFTADRTTALKEWLRNPEEVKFNGIYDNEKDIHIYKFMENSDIQTMIDKAMNKDNQCDPLVWMVNVSKKIPLYINALPIQRKVMDVANMMVHKNIYTLCH